MVTEIDDDGEGVGLCFSLRVLESTGQEMDDDGHP